MMKITDNTFNNFIVFGGQYKNEEKLGQLSVEKLNLTWNKQTNFNKLVPLFRVFKIALRGRGMGNLPRGGDFLSGGRNPTRSDLDLF